MNEDKAHTHNEDFHLREQREKQPFSSTLRRSEQYDSIFFNICQILHQEVLIAFDWTLIRIQNNREPIQVALKFSSFTYDLDKMTNVLFIYFSTKLAIVSIDLEMNPS